MIAYVYKNACILLFNVVQLKHKERSDFMAQISLRVDDDVKRCLLYTSMWKPGSDGIKSCLRLKRKLCKTAAFL